RRRHTRSKRDWSSDVCSSDLERVNRLGHVLLEPLAAPGGGEFHQQTAPFGRQPGREPVEAFLQLFVQLGRFGPSPFLGEGADDEIGRASCRERMYVADGPVTY